MCFDVLSKSLLEISIMPTSYKTLPSRRVSYLCSQITHYFKLTFFLGFSLLLFKTTIVLTSAAHILKLERCRLAWPPHKDDMQIHEVFCIFMHGRNQHNIVSTCPSIKNKIKFF